MAEIIFGPFNLDTAATRLLRDGVEVRLRPQALQALKVLLIHSGCTMRYEQMIAEAWDGTLVSRHTVNVTVGEVKTSLQEYGGWIVNRPKVGYKLEVSKSDELVRRGWHFWNRRTREGFERAIDAFHQAAEESPGDFRVFEGSSQIDGSVGVTLKTSSPGPWLSDAVRPDPASSAGSVHSCR
jgi:DNA-binding winged helix-turn-helix (wHTH) protein